MGNFYINEILSCQDQTLTREQLKAAAAAYLAETYQAKPSQIHYFNEAEESFSIDEVRRLQWESQHYSSFTNRDEIRVLVLLAFDTAGEAAQNAALKIIEEGPRGTLLLLVISDIDKLLPTIISRCKQVKWTVKEAEQQGPTPEVNWPTSYAQAIDLASTYKDRQLAGTQLTAMIKACPSVDWRKKKILFGAYQALSANANVLLTLENCFFNLVTLEKQLSRQALK